MILDAVIKPPRAKTRGNEIIKTEIEGQETSFYIKRMV